MLSTSSSDILFSHLVLTEITDTRIININNNKIYEKKVTIIYY